MKSPTPDLCVADEATFWPWHSWPEFASWPDRASTVVVVPMAGFSDWGLACPLDAEETVLLRVLKEASQRRAPDLSLLVVPPIRFVAGPHPGCAFAVGPDVACALLEEVVGSVADAGFKKVVFFNSSPWNEEITRAVGRDLRVARGLQMFCAQLSGLGLDFHPVRGGQRSRLKSLLAHLGDRPESEEAAGGAAILEEAAARLASFLSEIRARPPLANGGVLRAMTAP